jgi:prophage regulatory protein
MKIVKNIEQSIADLEVVRERLPLARFIRKPEVRLAVGLSDTTIWRLERRGEFPPRIEIIPGVVAWLEADVLAWIDARVRKNQQSKVEEPA